MTIHPTLNRLHRDAFVGGYAYRWGNPQAHYGNHHQSSNPDLDDIFDNGMLSAAQDQSAGRQYNPAAAWEAREVPVPGPRP